LADIEGRPMPPRRSSGCRSPAGHIRPRIRRPQGEPPGSGRRTTMWAGQRSRRC